MSFDEKNQAPPAYTQASNANGQYNFTYGNQYNEYPPEHPPQGNYPGYMYEQKGGQYQMTPPVVTQPGAVPMVVTPVPHQDWMVPAVLACLCCCWPIGICAIMSASKANSAAARGDEVETARKTRSARNLVILSVVFGIIITTTSVVLRLLYFNNRNQNY